MGLRPYWSPWHHGIGSGCKRTVPVITTALPTRKMEKKRIYVRQNNSAELNAKLRYANTAKVQRCHLVGCRIRI